MPPPRHQPKRIAGQISFWCSDCERYKPSTEFHRRHRSNSDCRSGYAQYCKDCTSKRHKTWRTTNRTTYLAGKRSYVLANPEKVRASKKSDYIKHRDRRIATNKLYNKNNKERKRFLSQTRRTRKLKSINTFTIKDWRLLLSHSKTCHWCGKPWTKARRPTHDHIIPLSKGGDNTLENSCCSCLGCNLSKGARLFHPITGQGILL